MEYWNRHDIILATCFYLFGVLTAVILMSIAYRRREPSYEISGVMLTDAEVIAYLGEDHRQYLDRIG